MSTNGQQSAVKGGTGSTSTPANNVGTQARRKSSGSKFGGLMDQKRNSSDPAATARRQSFADQAKAPGFVGNIWNNLVKGSDKK